MSSLNMLCSNNYLTPYINGRVQVRKNFPDLLSRDSSSLISWIAPVCHCGSALYLLGGWGDSSTSNVSSTFVVAVTSEVILQHTQ
jgi:hypothetical protein